MLAVKQFQKKRGVVPARGREPVLVDRRNLLLQYRAKFLLLEGALSAEFDHARSLRFLFLLLLDRALRPVLLFHLRDFHRRLPQGRRADERKRDGQA